MSTWLALFRGINVGGKNKIPMALLRAALEEIECRNVRTYIQSGNVVFDSDLQSKPNLTERILDAVESQFGFRPQVLLLTTAEFQDALAGNPFPHACSNPKSLHFFFLATEPESPDLERMDSIALPSESHRLIGTVFYLHAPDGFARSKLAARAEQTLGVAATARNYNTVLKISGLMTDK